MFQLITPRLSTVTRGTQTSRAIQDIRITPAIPDPAPVTIIPTSDMLLRRPVATGGGITIGTTDMLRSTTTTTTTIITAGTGTTKLAITGTTRLITRAITLTT